MTNKKGGVIYIGVTSNLLQRTHQHKQSLIAGFTKKYRCYLLVYFEQHAAMEDAILAEKKLKNLGRAKKCGIIERDNPAWNDLTPTLH